MGEELRERVKERYAGAARSVLEGAGSSCCGSAGERGLEPVGIGFVAPALLEGVHPAHVVEVVVGGHRHDRAIVDERLELAHDRLGLAAARRPASRT